MKLTWHSRIETRWKDYPTWLQLVLIARIVVAAICVVLALAAWSDGAKIERDAFGQPAVARGPYLYPEKIKSGTFYLTAEQDRDYRRSNWMFFSAWAIVVVLGLGGNALQRRANNRIDRIGKV